MLEARRADDDGVAVLTLQLAVVGDPAQCGFSERQVVLGRDGFDGGKGLEVMLVPVPARLLERHDTFSKCDGLC